MVVNPAIRCLAIEIGSRAGNGCAQEGSRCCPATLLPESSSKTFLARASPTTFALDRVRFALEVIDGDSRIHAGKCTQCQFTITCCLRDATSLRFDAITFKKALFMNEIGDRIRQLRVEKGYTLRQLAPLVGVGFAYLSKVENGRLESGSGPSESLIHRLAEVLDADEDELLLLTHRVPPSIAERIFKHPDLFRRLAQCDLKEIERITRDLR